MRLFLDKTCSWAEKRFTDMNFPPPPPFMPDEDNNFGDSLVLDFRKWYTCQLVLSSRHQRVFRLYDVTRFPSSLSWLTSRFHASSFYTFGYLRKSSQISGDLRQSSEVVGKSSEIQVQWRQKFSRILLKKKNGRYKIMTSNATQEYFVCTLIEQFQSKIRSG